MLHIASRAADQVPDAVLRAMFEARKRVFVDLLKWDVPVLAGRFEIDQFDDAHATYLVLSDRDGGHLGSARLLPTMRPHILDSLFPELCESELPRGPTIFEITRFCLDRDLSAATRRTVRDQLVSALADFALDQGITQYTGVAEMGWLQQILAFGWRCLPLGMPVTIRGVMLGALSIDITAETPGLLHRAGVCASAAPSGGECRHAA